MVTDPTDDLVPLQDRLRRHVRSRLDVEGRPYLQNGAWSMMLEAATALDNAQAEIEQLTIDENDMRLLAKIYGEVIDQQRAENEKLRDFIVRHAIAKEDVQLLLQRADRLRGDDDGSLGMAIFVLETALAEGGKYEYRINQALDALASFLNELKETL